MSKDAKEPSKEVLAEIFASNGTCYYGKGLKADPAYIPCGNHKFGAVPCCQIGDYCLSDGACYNRAFRNTYLAGCTENSNYDGSTRCPQKGKLADHQWVGLVRCEKSSDETKKDEVWMGCQESSQPLNAVGDACKCEKTDLPDVPYFKAGPRLTEQALLPATAGGAITWAKGQGPSNTAVTQSTGVTSLHELSAAVVTATAQTTYTAGGASPTAGGAGASGTPAPPAATPEASSSGLSTGAKAGIGVGVAAGAIAILVIIWLLFRLNKRLGATPAAAATSEPPAESKSMLPQEPPTPAPAYSPHSPYGANADAVTPVVGAANLSPKPNQGYYAPQELDSSQYTSAPVEMAADPYVPPTGHAGHMSHVSQMSTQHTGHSSYAAQSSPGQSGFVSPQNTGPGAGFGGYTPQPQTNPGHPPAGYHEMRG